MRAIRDIVVVGAGPAGSGLAAALGALGWDVLLVERRALPHHKVCGEFLSPEAQSSLRTLGVYDAIAGLAPSRLGQARLVTSRGVALAVGLPGDAWGISRYALDEALARAAEGAGVELRTGVSAQGLEQTAQGWRVDLRTAGEPTPVEARAVVLACGRHAPPGLRPVRPRAAQGPSYVGVKCHYEELAMPPRVELFLFPGGYAGINPIEGGRANLGLLARRETFQQAGGNVRAMIAAAARWNPALAQRLAGARALPDTEVAVAPVDTEVAATPWDRVARLGDAASMIPPLCGDGMAMALRAAELCVPLAHAFLRGNSSADDWAQRYCTAWHQEFDQRLWVGRRLQALLAAPFLGDALIGLGNALPPLAAYFVHATRGR